MGLSRAADCGLDRLQYPSQFFDNEIAAGLSTAFLIITSVYLLWNTYCRATQIHREGRVIASIGLERKRRVLAVNTLSALLTSVVAIVLIFGTWPQPLQGAGLLVIVVAQVSVLGWQDRDIEWKAFPEKGTDVLGVTLTGYALYDARNRYMETSKNEFYWSHDPMRAATTAFALTGVGLLIGAAQQILVSRATTPVRKRLMLSICSALFVATHIATFACAVYYGVSTIPDSCALFNMTKITALATSALCLVYSVAIAAWRSCAIRVKDDDPMP